MNIHPIIVHFPIALLTLYSLFELLRFRKLLEMREWFYIKSLFLFLGFGGALLAIATGEFGEEIFGETRVVETHEKFAKITAIIFAIICAIYLVRFINYLFEEKIKSLSNINFWEIISNIISGKIFSVITVLLALFGLTSLLITGTLGGIIVYGVDSDIFTQIIGNLFNLKR